MSRIARSLRNRCYQEVATGLAVIIGVKGIKGMDTTRWVVIRRQAMYPGLNA